MKETIKNIDDGEKSRTKLREIKGRRERERERLPDIVTRRLLMSSVWYAMRDKCLRGKKREKKGR